MRTQKKLVFESLCRALERRDPKKLEIPGFAPSAVLVPVIEREGAISIAFMERPEEAPNHSGQISFPGGHRKPGEKAAEAALREAREELGIPAKAVKLLGELDDVATPLGFIITPVVGWLVNPTPFQANAREVKSHFEVSLDELCTPKNFIYRGEHTINGRSYPLPEYRVSEKLIWGATARIMQQLLEILRTVPPDNPSTTL